ncbi:MAG TPA: 4Fe-4S dicluster domain-containing protein [Dehalococcoidia bacterium]
MTIKKISKKDMVELLLDWGREMTVLVPSRDKGVTEMTEWDGKDISFLGWYRNTVIPTKSSFLPPVEEMFTFQKNGNGYQIEVSPGQGKRVVFGVRPCDARAIAIMDKVFTDSHEDPYYVSKRKNTVLIGLGCTNPYDSCFCTSSGISPAESTDVDLMFTDIGDDFVIEEITEVGKELLATASIVKKASQADAVTMKKARAAVSGMVTRKVDTKNIVDKLQACFNDSDFWEKVAAKCVGCGVCTLLCPTCCCFDICDELFKKQGARYRTWDSCGFSSYTKMPMENPREEKWRRVRQKVCHKYEFFPMNSEVIACTGCGRCIRLCPVNWDITEVLASVPAEQPIKNK